MFPVKRSTDCPQSLKDPKGYDGEDVKRRLLEDFFSKCWLTEEVLTLGSISIDHFRPQQEFKALRFEWENLFPASMEANSRRPRKWPDGGLIDPTKCSKISDRIAQDLSADGEYIHFYPLSNGDTEAVNTARMLNHIFNDSGRAKWKAIELRQAVKDAYTQVLVILVRLLQFPEGTAEHEKALEHFRRRTALDAPYSTFIRNAISGLSPSCAKYFQTDDQGI